MGQRLPDTQPRAMGAEWGPKMGPPGTAKVALFGKRVFAGAIQSAISR